jgi:hypothetical protein
MTRQTTRQNHLHASVFTAEVLATAPATFRDDRFKLGSLLGVSLRVFL